MSLTGNFRGLELLRANLARLSRVPSQAARDASDAITADWQKNFSAGKDPYGRAWKPLKPATVRKKGHSRINYLTGNTLAGAVATPMAGSGIKIGPFPDYAVFPNRSRPFVPVGSLPTAWVRAIDEAVNRRIKETLGAR